MYSGLSVPYEHRFYWLSPLIFYVFGLIMSISFPYGWNVFSYSCCAKVKHAFSAFFFFV